MKTDLKYGKDLFVVFLDAINLLWYVLSKKRGEFLFFTPLSEVQIKVREIPRTLVAKSDS